MMKNKKYLVIDTETGGLNPEKNSILSIAGVLWEPGKTVEPVFDLYVKEHFINVEEAALKVNKIDMNKVHTADEPYVVVKKIQNALNERFGSDRKAIQLVGHNVAFDIAFIKRLYRHAGLESAYKDDFRDRAMDSCSILEFLMLSGITCTTQSKTPWYGAKSPRQGHQPGLTTSSSSPGSTLKK